jgi:DNA-binding response OmpR family regulator
MHAKILVVDDEPDVVDLIGFNMRRAGYEVLVAHNGLEALLKARRFHPDLVVLDVMMEGMDGLSVCEILRTQPSTKSIPVIIVTAAAGEMARLNSFACGATDFMTKPFSPQALVRKVGHILDVVAAHKADDHETAA